MCIDKAELFVVEIHQVQFFCLDGRKARGLIHRSSVMKPIRKDFHVAHLVTWSIKFICWIVKFDKTVTAGIIQYTSHEPLLSCNCGTVRGLWKGTSSQGTMTSNAAVAAAILVCTFLGVFMAVGSVLLPGRVLARAIEVYPQTVLHPGCTVPWLGYFHSARRLGCHYWNKESLCCLSCFWVHKKGC